LFKLGKLFFPTEFMRNMKTRNALFIFSIAFGCLNVSPIWSQEIVGKPELKVGTYTDVLKFDGRVDEPCWQLEDSIANLTRFSLFFPEKRQFFLEGSDIYSFG